MITKDTENTWWLMFLHFLQKKDSPVIPILTIVNPEIDLPYTLLEKKHSVRSFDRMFIDFSLHYCYAQHNEEQERAWIHCIQDALSFSVKFSETTTIFQEKGLTIKGKDKKERRVSADYEGFVFLRPPQ